MGGGGRGRRRRQVEEGVFVVVARQGKMDHGAEAGQPARHAGRQARGFRRSPSLLLLLMLPLTLPLVLPLPLPFFVGLVQHGRRRSLARFLVCCLLTSYVRAWCPPSCASRARRSLVCCFGEGGMSMRAYVSPVTLKAPSSTQPAPPARRRFKTAAAATLLEEREN